MLIDSSHLTSVCVRMWGNGSFKVQQNLCLSFGGKLRRFHHPAVIHPEKE